MKNETETKEAMENIKSQLTRAGKDEVLVLQGQFAALEWVLDEKEKKDEE